jgi:CRP-like cAMP-binding protein
MLYVVMKGKVRIFGTGPAGNEISIRIFSPQDMIGEFAAIDGRTRSTTAQAVENCILLEMEQSKFVLCLRDMPDLSMEMIGLLVGKLRWTTAYVETIAQFNTVGRLIQTLLHYIRKFGVEIEAGKRYEVDLSISQADLASMVGASREWINRILRDWSQRGLIEYKRSKITILDLPAVEKERDRRVKTHGDRSK